MYNTKRTRYNDEQDLWRKVLVTTALAGLGMALVVIAGYGIAGATPEKIEEMLLASLVGSLIVIVPLAIAWGIRTLIWKRRLKPSKAVGYTLSIHRNLLGIDDDVILKTYDNGYIEFAFIPKGGWYGAGLADDS